MAKILHIDPDLQQVNRIRKDDSNNVLQITDKAQNIPIVINGTNYATYSYNGYFICSNARYNSNDDEVINGTTLYFHILNNDHSAIGTSGVLYKKGNLIIRQKTNANNLEIEINSSVVIDYPLAHSVDIYFAIYFDGTNVYLVENGTVKAKSPYTGLSAIGTTDLFGDGTNYFKGYVYSISKWDNDIFGINGKIINDGVVYFNYDFIHLNRYKNDGNKVLFLSSRYLKDAVIDSSNEISSIYPEIGSQLSYAVTTNKPYISSKGFLLGNVSTQQQLIYASNINLMDTFVSGMFRKDDAQRKYAYWCNSSVLVIGIESDGRVFLYTAALGFKYVSGNHNGKHVNIAFLGHSDNTIDLFVNGVLSYKSLVTGIDLSNISDFKTYAYNLYPIYVDDILIIKNVLPIDPTGYVVGDKVFQPPKRKSLENYIDVPYYSNGKYTTEELFKMIGVDGYIPVASVQELSNISNSSSFTMGAGTPFEASYLCGTDKKYVQVSNFSIISTTYAPVNTLVGGVYDGNNLTITLGLEKNATGLAVFNGVNSSGIIRNVVTLGSINALSGTSTSGICYYNQSTGLVENCFNAATVYSSGAGSSGIASINGGTVRNCTNIAQIDGAASSSGIVSSNYAGAIIEYCTNYGQTNSNNGSYGGLVASTAGIVRKCVNYGSAYASQYHVGAFGGSNTGTIEDCYSFGNASADLSYVGGFIGRNNGGTVTNCYCVGTVSGASAQGFCGRFDSGTMSGNYYNSTISGKSDTIGATPKTTTELQADSIGSGIYANWSTAIWGKQTGAYYPKLSALVGYRSPFKRL